MKMEKPLIMMSSVTYAMRGRELLRKHGIKSTIERTPKNKVLQGCGYSLYAGDRTDEAIQLLQQNGIRILGRTEGS